MTSNPLIVFDVDYTILGPHGTALPGVQLLFDMLATLGFEIHLWSAGGEAHAREVAERFTLHGTVRGYHSKPDYPMTEEAAIAVLGRAPVLQVDDDGWERVGSWPFFRMDTWRHLTEETQ